MVPLDPFWLVHVFHKRSVLFCSTVLVELGDAQFQNAESTVSFEKKATKQELLVKESNNGVLKARVRQLLSDTCSSRNRTSQDVLFYLIGYQRLVSRFST